MFEPFVTVIFNFGEVCCFTNLETTFIFTNIALREAVYTMTYIHLYPTSLIYSGNKGPKFEKKQEDSCFKVVCRAYNWHVNMHNI